MGTFECTMRINIPKTFLHVGFVVQINHKVIFTPTIKEDVKNPTILSPKSNHGYVSSDISLINESD